MGMCPDYPYPDVRSGVGVLPAITSQKSPRAQFLPPAGAHGAPHGYGDVLLKDAEVDDDPRSACAEGFSMLNMAAPPPRPLLRDTGAGRYSSRGSSPDDLRSRPTL